MKALTRGLDEGTSCLDFLEKLSGSSFQNSLDRLSGCNLDGCSLHAAGSPGCFMSGLKKQVSTADLFCVISLVQRRTALASKPSGSYRC